MSGVQCPLPVSIGEAGRGLLMTLGSDCRWASHSEIQGLTEEACGVSFRPQTLSKCGCVLKVGTDDEEDRPRWRAGGHTRQGKVLGQIPPTGCVIWGSNLTSLNLTH